MRCEQCRSTGFTEDELADHLAKTNHDAGKSATRSDEFEPAPTPTSFSAEDMADFQKFLEWRKKQARPPETPPGPTPPPGPGGPVVPSKGAPK